MEFAPTGRKQMYGFPLWGKLAAKPTDEGVSAGSFPLIRRVPRHLPPQGEGFSAAMTILRVVRRGDIYAARCSHTDIAT